MADTEKCKSCGRQVASRLKFCNFCGWANAQDMRLCLKCEGPVILHNGIGANRAAGGVGGIGGFLLFYFLGVGLGLGIVFGFGAIAGLASLFTMGYQCGMCDKPAPDNILSKDEKDARAKRRLGIIGGTAVFAVASIGAFALWLWAVKSRLSGS